MDAHEDTPRIQVLPVSDLGRRRRWTDAEKVRIVEESYGLGLTLAEVARRHEISRSMLYDWRHRHKLGLLGPAAVAPFMRLMPLEIAPAPAVAAGLSAPPQTAMMIDLGGQYRVTIPVGFDMEAAARLLNGLVVRR